jgi:hypothetical protein
MIGRNLLPTARQSTTRTYTPCYNYTSRQALEASRTTSIPILLSHSSSSSQTQISCPRRTPIQRRDLNTASHTPQLVSKHKLGSVPSPAESVGEPPIKKSEKKRGKLWDSADEAVKDLKSGSVILSAGESELQFGREKGKRGDWGDWGGGNKER